MKRILKSTLSILLAITIILSSAIVGLSEVDFGGLFAVRVEAASESDLTFTLNSDGESYSVTGCDKSVSGEIVIPATHKSLPVTCIGDEAFNDCTKLTSIIIPNSITGIGVMAFDDCSGITTLTIPDSVTSIGQYAFDSCSSLTTIRLPNNITTIPESAFIYCDNLTTITIPNGVTSIGRSAFYGCSKLVSITIPDSVTNISLECFYGTAYYDNEDMWEDGALYINNHLIEVKTYLNDTYTIKEGTKTIANAAFLVGLSLTSIIIPDSVTNIAKFAFYDCTNLTDVYYEGTEEQWRELDIDLYNEKLTNATIHYNYDAEAVPKELVFTLNEDGESYSVTDCDTSASGEIVIPSTYKGLPVTSIGDYAFQNCTNITSITIPDSVTSIGDLAFEYCSYLVDIRIPDSVTSIGSGAFYNCCDLKSVNIPSGIKIIEDGLFIGCENLTSIIIPDGVTAIEVMAFGACSRLAEITIPDSVTLIEERAFLGCSSLYDVYYTSTRKDWDKIEKQDYAQGESNGCLALARLHCATLGFTLNEDGESYSVAYCDPSVSGEVVIPSTHKGLPVTKVGNNAFYNCTDITSVIIPNGVTSIGEEAFAFCSNLASVTIPDSVKSIGAFAFAYSVLESVTIPEGIEIIEAFAFSGTKLTTITIPDSVTSIGYEAFSGCPLETVDFGENVEVIDGFAFSWCSKLKSITLPDSVINIGESAFYGCNSLTTVTVGKNVTDIGYGAFWECTNLNNIQWNAERVHDFDSPCAVFYRAGRSGDGIEFVFGEDVEHIPANLCNYCDPTLNPKIASVTIPDGVKSIGDKAFYECESLNSIVIPDTITDIGSGAFHYTGYYLDESNWEEEALYIGNHLIEMNGNGSFGVQCFIKDGTKTIADGAIESYIGCESIVIPDSVTNIGNGAINGDFWFVFYKGTEEQWNDITIDSDNVLRKIHYAATDHTASDEWTVEKQPSCTDYGYRYKACVVCEYPVIEEYPAKLKHTPGDVVYDRRPTCVEGGEGCHHCTKCGQCLGFEMLPATGHNYSSEWTIDVQPTCTTSGSKSRHCLNGCSYDSGKTDVTEILPLGHTLTDWIIDKSATCTESGSRHKDCTVCKETVVTEEIPAIGHAESEWIIETLATCTKNGLRYKECTECDVVLEVETIIATGHIYSGWVIDDSFETRRRECTACGDVQTEALVVTNLNVLELPTTTTFIRGTEFDFTGLKIQLECADGLTKIIDVTADMTTGGDINKVGTQTIIFAAGGATVSFDVNVVYQSIKMLTIESLPDKTSYIEGQTIDTTGLVVKAEYEDGTSENVTEYELEYDKTLIGEQNVTVKFGDATATFPVTFTAKKLVSITVTKMPDKTTYVVGDSFDNKGMVVTATYDNGLSEAVTGYTVSALPKTPGAKNLIVSFGGKRVIIKVTVVEKEAISMEVVEPEKFEYVLGDEFDPAGMVVTVTFNNGDVEDVTDYTIEGFGEFVGVGVVTINYNGLTYDLIIIMHSPADNWVVESDATCTTEGVKHLYCTECGEIAKTEIIPATGHDYDEKIIKEATCTETGLRDGSTCKTCGDVVSEQTIIPALGHDYADEFTIDVESTCKADGSKSRHCSRCDAKTDVTVIKSNGHNYNDWNVITEATCETTGERTRNCSVCGEFFAETISAYGHVYSVVWTTDKTPTCTVPGSKSHHCNRCGDKTDITEIAPLGHSFGDWTEIETPDCTTEGQRVRMCSVCYSEEVEEIPALGHSYGEWIVDSVADCKNDGERHAICGVCNTKTAEKIKAYGHDYESVFTVDKEATCTESGLKSHHCSRCEEKTDVTTILPLGHHVSTMWTIDTEPTCETKGSKSHHCLRCDVKSDETVIPVASHIYGKWEVVTPATMDADGIRAHKCYNCEMTEEDIIPKLFKYTATFVADGDVVATVDFPEDATAIEIPEVPHKDKFNGEWENFDVRNKNFTVNAVYTPISVDEVEGIKTNNTADYYSSTGEVEVNLNVSAPGKTIVTSTTKSVPLDIVFVLDQSGSMADGGKKNALKNAVSSFSDAILDDAIANGVDHRIAVVGFASGGNDNLNYQNTELLTADVVKYSKITNADYKKALVSVNDNGALNEVIADAVKAIDAEGATRADLGFEMASNIFANTPITDNRQRVVVFLTDGVPTSYSNFEYSVANVAIQNAYQLKDTYNATVYSVGVFDRNTSANTSVNNFMNYVSSNYNEKNVMKKNSGETTENTSGYYLDVSDVSTLSDVFTSIVEETTTHTGRFTSATLKYTLTKYFTLTSVQEETIRKNAAEKLNVTNEQVSVTREANGTTTIVISDVEPWASGTNYVIDFAFRATANGNTLKSGTYQVGTFESGVILENGGGYEAVFAPQSVDIGGTSGIAVFNINNIPYAINRLSSITMVVAPATSFGADYNFIGWNVPNNLTLNNEVRVFDAELLKNEYKISWNIDGEITEVKYMIGDFITIPEVENNSIGGAFVGWDKAIPETMPSENLTITAVYDAHYHKYDVTKIFKNCAEGGTLSYNCECGDAYTEEIAPCEHSWEVITASNNKNAIENAGSRCTVCGIKDSKALRLESRNTYQEADASYNTATVELDYVDEQGDKHQPDGDIEISVQLDEVFETDIPDDAIASVYRVNDDGSRTKLESEQKGMNMTFTTDHFSTYEFEFTTGEQRNLFAQKNSRIDYENKLIFTEIYGAKEFKSLVTYLAPAKLVSNKNISGFFGTGTSIDLSKNGVTDNYKVIVNGDTNGDSVCDVLDCFDVERASNDNAELYGAYAEAGDINGDGIIDIADYQAIINKAVA